MLLTKNFMLFNSVASSPPPTSAVDLYSASVLFLSSVDSLKAINSLSYLLILGKKVGMFRLNLTDTASVNFSTAEI